MNRQDMEKVQMYFEAALAVPEARRDQFLTQLCGDDSDIAREVRALLEADDKSRKWDANTLFKPDLSRNMNIKAGDEIGPHRILEQIGEGGMGVIYKALDTRLERHVALKFLPANLHSDAEIRQRFLAEARAASRLDHPNICVIHDVGETAGGQLYITMPCYEGETLAQRISRGPLPLDEALDIAIQVASGLAAAHTRNIVHRDVKPSNIMLTDDGGIKVLDFGIAKVENLHLTSTGMSIGTIAYMSPEQLRGEPVDARTDVWALGVVLFEMLNGKQAFSGKALPDVLQAVLHDGAETVELAIHIPDTLMHILQTAMQRDLAQRYPDMAAMLQALQALTADNVTETAPADPAAAQATRLMPSARQPSAYAWDEQLLDSIAQLLLPELGPIAPTLVQRLARQAPEPAVLAEQLAAQLPNPASRQAFLQQLESRLAALTTPPLPRGVKTDGSLLGVELSAALLAEMETALLPHLGPIAQTMIRRYAANTSSLAGLCEKLAQQIDNENDKQAFLQHMERHLKNL